MTRLRIATALAAIAALLMFGANSRGAEKSDTPAATEMIVVSKAADLLNALNALGGHEESFGQGANQRVIMVPYTLSADTLWAVADDITALRKVVVTYQETVKALTDQAAAKNGGKLSEDPAVAKALADQIQKLFDSERPVAKLFRIKRGDLKLGENKIPPAVLSSLGPILDP